MLRTFNELGVDLNQPNKNGATPAFIAAQNGDVTVLHVLKELGANLNQPDKYGATPALLLQKKDMFSCCARLRS